MSIANGYRYVGQPPVSKLRCTECQHEYYRDAVYDSAAGWILTDEDFECPECGGKAEERYP